jgi:hypothetical protein
MLSRAQIAHGNEIYRFSFALVVEEVANFRNSVMALLRQRGWLVHGTNCAEEALRLLAHIPYNLIVLDSELPGMGWIDLVRYAAKRHWSGERFASLLSPVPVARVCRVRLGDSVHFWQANQAGKSIFLNS